MKNRFAQYMHGVWESRYFWIHLALSDLKSRWRRSFFGILWTIIQPLGMTLLISFVFGKVFNTPIREYAPYIFSGIIIWDFIITSSIAGSLSFIQADAYIKQCKHPLAIYTLRTVLGNLIVCMLASLGLLVWVLLALPENMTTSWIVLPLIYPILLAISWPLASIFAYIATRFRDLPHALGLALQAMWFVSPIYFEEKVFRRGLSFLVDYNPIYHLLQLIRAPLLHGELPTLTNYAYSVGTAAVLSLIAIYIGRHAEKKVIFYL